MDSKGMGLDVSCWLVWALFPTVSCHIYDQILVLSVPYPFGSLPSLQVSMLQAGCPSCACEGMLWGMLCVLPAVQLGQALGHLLPALPALLRRLPAQTEPHLGASRESSCAWSGLAAPGSLRRWALWEWCARVGLSSYPVLGEALHCTTAPTYCLPEVFSCICSQICLKFLSD